MAHQNGRALPEQYPVQFLKNAGFAFNTSKYGTQFVHIDFFLSFSLSLNQTNRNSTQDRLTTLP